MLHQYRKIKVLTLLACISLFSSIPVASMPVKLTIQSETVQETAIPEPSKIHVKKLYGYMWSGYAGTEDKLIVR